MIMFHLYEGVWCLRRLRLLALVTGLCVCAMVRHAHAHAHPHARPQPHRHAHDAPPVSGMSAPVVFIPPSRLAPATDRLSPFDEHLGAEPLTE